MATGTVADERTERKREVGDHEEGVGCGDGEVRRGRGGGVVGSRCGVASGARRPAHPADGGGGCVGWPAGRLSGWFDEYWDERLRQAA